ncbi:hypothetical protein RchiOBHm_Chr7g0211811 [Rosa chinensis]|uniref:Uncharacterized protein n=1 Tax=Rosa chinensis TaxID=74649 RepID=A0A2P6PAJ0_ROSCH|nr:hypothetical protein RchiOBHm_Chr7g0211811 [Rosa chinensis]
MMLLLICRQSQTWTSLAIDHRTEISLFIPFPKKIQDSQINDYFVKMNLFVERYGVSCTLNEIERTITLSETNSHNGYFVMTSYTNYFHQNQGTKLQEAWPMVESSLELIGISCTLNMA